MDLSILLRLLPAVAVATGVAMVVDPARRLRVGAAFDEVLRVLLVGLVAGRLGWLVLAGPTAWRTALGTAILVRAGVETGIGVLAAAGWVGWRRRDHDHWWRLTAAVPVALAGAATWQALCQVEGVCGGVPVSWGVALPGRAVPAFPSAYVEASVLLGLFVLAWRWRSEVTRLWWIGAVAALARALLGFTRPALVGHPTSDQWFFLLVAGAATVVAVRLGGAVPGRTRIEVARDRHLAVTVAPGTGPVLLLAHGVGSSAAFLREAFSAPLARAGWRLATVDLRGHADSTPASDPADHLVTTHAADLAVVARAVGAEVVGGVSIGAMAAVLAAGDGLSVRAVVAVIPGWTGAATPGVGPHAAVAEEVRTQGVAAMLERLEADVDMPAWIREVVLRDYRRHHRASLEAALVALDGGAGPTTEQLARVDVPLALVGWRDDPGHPWEVAHQWADLAPRSSLVETSMEAMQADRQAFGEAVVAALADLGVPAGPGVGN